MNDFAEKEYWDRITNKFQELEEVQFKELRKEIKELREKCYGRDINIQNLPVPSEDYYRRNLLYVDTNDQ